MKKVSVSDIVKKIDLKFPPLTFLVETSYGKGVLERGVQESSYVRRLTQEERKMLDYISSLIEIKL